MFRTNRMVSSLQQYIALEIANKTYVHGNRDSYSGVARGHERDTGEE